MNRLLVVLRERLRKGETIVIHCMGGLGRTGLMAAGCLIAATRDLTPEDAIEIVRQARPGTLETRQQENYISKFGEFLKAREIS